MPKNDSRLGRGLSAIFGDINNSEDKIDNISVDLIVKNKNQPRSKFDKKSLKELAESIKEKGVLQPILVRAQGEKYEIIAGERRFLAAKMANLEYIPAIVKELGDEESAEIALIENLQRENLNPVEEALAYKGLMDKFGYTQETLAKKVGKERTTISNTIRLLSLPDEIIEMLKNGDLSAGHARAILSLSDNSSRLEMAKKIKSKKMSVRDAEKAAKKENGTDSNNLHKYEEKLRKILNDSKVKIALKKGMGKIEIRFKSEEELNKIFERLGL